MESSRKPTNATSEQRRTRRSTRVNKGREGRGQTAHLGRGGGRGRSKSTSAISNTNKDIMQEGQEEKEVVNNETKMSSLRREINKENDKTTTTTSTDNEMKPSEVEDNGNTIVDWNDTISLRKAITKLRKETTGEVGDRKAKIAHTIRGYEERYKELIIEKGKSAKNEENNEDVENMESEENGDEEMEEVSINNEMESPHINGEKIDWNDMIKLNEILNKHQIQAANPNITDKEKSHLETLIGTFNHRIQQLLTEKENEILEEEKINGPSFVDYIMLNVASNRALNNGIGWDDLSVVNATILGIQLEKIKEDNPKERENMDRVTDMYMIRKKQLLQEMALRDEAMIQDGVIVIDDDTGVVKMGNLGDTQEEDDVIMTKVLENDNKTIHSEATQSYPESAHGIEVKMSDSTTSKKSRRTSPTGDPYTMNKKKKINENSGNDDTKKSYSKVLNSRMEQENCDAPNIRIRFQFRLNAIKGKTFGEQIRPLLHDIVMCTKLIDPNTQIVPWRENSKVCPASGPEILLLAESTMKAYIMAPSNPEALTTNKTYHHYGLRIVTDIPVAEFTEQWNNNKYQYKDEYPCLSHVSMRPAEMQLSHSAYAVGYFQGSTERGEYSTIKESLVDITDVTTEASWQVVNQKDVSNRIWERATSKAIEAQRNPNHRLHKRTKFRYAPSALVVYVAKKEHVKDATMKLYEAYGKTIDGHWPTLKDGSKMRFIPIIRGDIEEGVLNKLYNHMEIHTRLKANEETKEIGVCDIHQPKEYLNGMTLEQVLHSTVIGIDSTTQVHILKHITKKWMQDASVVRYEIAFHTKLREKALEFLQNLEEQLASKYGNEARLHFPWSKHPFKKNATQAQNAILMNYINNEETDKQIQNMLMQEDDDEQYAKIQLEGIEVVQDMEARREEQSVPRAMLIHTGNSLDSMSGISTNSKSTNGSVTWDKGIEGKERTKENAHATEKAKIINSCAKYDLKDEEIQNWLKKKYSTEYGSNFQKLTLSELQNKLDYSVWKEIFIDIKATRKIAYKQQQEDNTTYDAPQLDLYLSQAPSEEFIPPGEGGSNGTSHPTTGELSNSDQKKQESGVESGGQ